jgi:hypothetical protein
MSYVGGDTEDERFVAAQAFYVATHQHNRRPGKSLAGFHKALAKLPLPLLRLLPAAVRRWIGQRFFPHCRVHGFWLFGGDGSRLECPRSKELEQRLGEAGKPDSAPTVWLTALVLLPLGIPWAWWLGKGTGSEHRHVQRLLKTLPPQALLVLDAGFVSYALYRAIVQDTTRAFVVRMSSRAYLYTQEGKTPATRRRDQEVVYWPSDAQKAGQPPIQGRLIRVKNRKSDVWLFTSVRSRTRLSAHDVATIYRWRWQNEGLFRFYKQTLAKYKLTGRTVTMVHREAEVSLLSLQVLLASNLRIEREGGRLVLKPASVRCVLLAWRGVITLTLGSCLGPRQGVEYLRRVSAVPEQGRRRRQSAKSRRAWPRRKPHKPPKAPHLRPMPPSVRALMDRMLRAA